MDVCLMSEMKKYTDVVRLGHKSTVGVLTENDHIVVQEKLDGANASFKVEDGKVLAFSRNTQLSEGNTLRGFYQWTQTLNPDDLLEGIVYFGEWLVKHKLDYGDNMHQFYLFDVYNTNIEEYVHFSMVKDEAKRLSLNLIPILYEGQYQSFEHLQSFVGKSSLGDEGEGVVVKNVNYKDRFGKQVFVKLVTDKFREVQKQKAPKDPNKVTQEMIFVNTFLRKGRVEKLLHKLVDEGVLDEQFGIEDMGIILKNLGQRSYDDMLKEERDFLPEEFDEKELRKSVGKKLPVIVKQIIQERELVAV
jgi:hypothetical protein